MPHDVTLIAMVAAGFGLAMLFGIGASLLRMPPLVGYLLAGVMIGPHTPGFVADIRIAMQLAEIGVMLLMFGVGLHFSLGDLLAVRRIAIPGAILQIAVAVALGTGVGLYWDYGPGGALVFGLCLSVASTVVLLRALEARGQLDSMDGRIAVGWLIVEDLVMVLVLVLLPALTAAFAAKGAAAAAGEATSAAAVWKTLGLTLAKVAAFVVLMLVVGKRLLPKLLWWVARTGSRELFTLGVIAAAVGVAFGAAKLFDVSFALGAFFAGMMLRESEFSHRAADESLPLRDAFAVLFFVSVGMLFDPSVLWEAPAKLALVVAIIMIGKTLAAVALVLAFGYPLSTALTVGASLAQIGEFSFILAGLGVALGLLTTEAQSMVLAGAMISIAANAMLFRAIGPIQRAIEARSRRARRLAGHDDPLAQLPMSTDPKLLERPLVLIGHGRIGRRVAEALHAAGRSVIVAEQNREIVDALRAEGRLAVAGDATTPDVLIQAHVARAGTVIITLPDATQARPIIDIVHTLNPEARILVCSADPLPEEVLDSGRAIEVIRPAEAMAESVLARLTRGGDRPAPTPG